ncbi:MAG: phosphatidylserine/phosphatidylglycerophosphate/cardiolipin synthase family protein [Candidatus Sericytochromatia bacterium]|nr:phosphatidylserine/phosphatidylglycerophosphate/cardiolipin synthase family protein [Candidatus Sericytochromatia bacterium]
MRLFSALLTLLALLVQGCGADLPGFRSGSNGSRIAARDVRGDAMLQAFSQGLARTTSSDNDIRLKLDGEEGFAAIHDLVRSARRTLWIETFIWHNDATGIALAKALRDRKRAGVDVRIILDTFGSRHWDSDRAVTTIMTDAGIPVRLYNRNLVRSADLHLTHRKLYLADGQRGLTGGMNIGDEYAVSWHDLLIDVRGTAALQMHQEFQADWNGSGDGPAETLQLPAAAEPAGTHTAALAITNPNDLRRRREIHGALIRSIRAARERIRMFHIYVSEDTLIDELIAAHRRGVSVQVMLPVANDSIVFRTVNKHYGRILRDAGVEVRLFDRTFSHIKYWSFDDRMVVLGSANADARSMYENLEVSLAITAPDVVADAERRVFEADWATSRLPTDHDLEIKPKSYLSVLLAEWFNDYL